MIDFFIQFLEMVIEKRALTEVTLDESFVKEFGRNRNFFPVVFSVYLDKSSERGDGNIGQSARLDLGCCSDSLIPISRYPQQLVIAIYPTITHIDYFDEKFEPSAINIAWSEAEVEQLRDEIRQIIELEPGEYLDMEQIIRGNLLLLKILKFCRKSSVNEDLHADIRIFYQLTALITPQHTVIYKRPEFAEKLGVSEHRLNNIVKSLRGFSFQTYYSLCRLEVARRLLVLSNQKVAEAAKNCGFKNYAYFVQLFRQFYHITPLQFKKLFHKRDKTLEELECLNFTEGFVNLTLENTRLETVPVEDVVHCACMVCNTTDKKMKLYARLLGGECKLMELFQPGERVQFGFNTGTVLEICSEDDTLLGSCYSLSVPSLIVCTDKKAEF